MHGRERLAVDLRVGNENPFAGQRLVLLFEVDVDFRTYEGCDGLLVCLCTDDEHLVALVEDGITVRDAQFTLVNETGHHEVAVEEVVYLQQRLALEVLIRHLQVHLKGLFVCIGLFERLQTVFLLLELDLARVPY